MIYKLRPNPGFTPKNDTETLGLALQEIHNEYGRIKPETVVKVAAKKDHVLHKEFTWNNTEAGSKWRLHEARNIIKCVNIIHGDTDKKIETSAFVSIREDDKTRAYHPVKTVLGNDQMRAIYMNQARRELRMFIDRFSNIEYLIEYTNAVENLIKSLDKEIEETVK